MIQKRMMRRRADSIGQEDGIQGKGHVISHMIKKIEERERKSAVDPVR